MRPLRSLHLSLGFPERFLNVPLRNQQPLRLLVLAALDQPDVIQGTPALPAEQEFARGSQGREAAARASTISTTSPLSASIPARYGRGATLAQTRPPAHSRSLRPPIRCPSIRTTTVPSGISVCGSRRTSSLLPSLVSTYRPVLQMPQPSRL